METRNASEVFTSTFTMQRLTMSDILSDTLHNATVECTGFDICGITLMNIQIY